MEKDIRRVHPKTKTSVPQPSVLWTAPTSGKVRDEFVSPMGRTRVRVADTERVRGFALGPALAIGCATRFPETKVTTMGTPRPPHPDGCDLTLITQSDSWPGGKYDSYESVAIVSVYSPSSNAQPGDEDVKAKVKPRACAVGGELIALISSTGLHNRYGKTMEGRQLSFQVLAKKMSQETKY